MQNRRGPATVTGDLLATRPAEGGAGRGESREPDTCYRGGADAFRGESDSAPMSSGRQLGSTTAWSGRGVANLLSTILRVVTIGVEPKGVRMIGHPKPRRTAAGLNLLARQRRIPLLARRAGAGAALSAGLLVAGCGSDSTTTTAAPATTASTAAPAETTTTAPSGDTTTSTASQGSEGTFPVTVTDDDGDTVTIAAKPMRIVSTTPASTEILFAIGAGDRVVGVSSLDDYPPEVANIAKVGDFQPNTEAIMGLSPDLVISYSGYEEQLDAGRRPRALPSSPSTRPRWTASTPTSPRSARPPATPPRRRPWWSRIKAEIEEDLRRRLRHGQRAQGLLRAWTTPCGPSGPAPSSTTC